MYAGRGSKGVPVNTGIEFVPDGVNVCVCVGNAEPVNTSAGTVCVCEG